MRYDSEEYGWFPCPYSSLEYFSGTTEQAVEHLKILNTQQFSRITSSGDLGIASLVSEIKELKEKLEKIRAIEDESIRELMDEDKIAEDISYRVNQVAILKKQIDTFKNLDYTNKAFYLPHVPHDMSVYVFEEIHVDPF